LSFKESPDAVNRNFKEFIIKSLCNSSVRTMYNICKFRVSNPDHHKKNKKSMQLKWFIWIIFKISLL